MFLTHDAWRHPNPFTQTLARPATVWNCLTLECHDASLLVEIRHFEGREVVACKWNLIAVPELLLSAIEETPEQVGSVQLLIRPHGNQVKGWQVEDLVALEQWRWEDNLGIDCIGTSGRRFAFPLRPEGARTMHTCRFPLESTIGRSA